MNMLLRIGLISVLLGQYSSANGQIKMENSQHLDKKQQSTVGIAALTARGDLQYLKDQLNSGLNNGLTINEIKEILIQLYAYCGFPRSLNAINTFMTVLDERKAQGITDFPGKDASPITETNKYETGKKTIQTLTGREEKTLSGANAFAPAIDTFLKEHLFADIFSRDVLSYQQRELVTISALAAMSGVEPQLQAHLGIGINIRLTGTQLSEAVKIIGELTNENQETIARTLLKKVVAKTME